MWSFWGRRSLRVSICRGFGCLRGGWREGEERGKRRKMKEEEGKRRREKRRREGEVKRVWVDEDVKSFPLFFHSVLIIDHHLPTNKMPLFSNPAISVFDEKFPGSGLVFDSLSLDIRCYKTVQVLEREASNSSPSQFLSPSPHS